MFNNILLSPLEGLAPLNPLALKLYQQSYDNKYVDSIYKFVGAKITQTHARTKGKGQTGGKMTRLRCGGFTPDQEALFSSKTEWSIALSTEWGIIPTLYYVKPKKQGKNNQNSVKIRPLEIDSKGKLPKICYNFENKNSLFDIVKHYCGDWKVISQPVDRPSISCELFANFLMLEDNFSKRGLLVIYDPDEQVQLRYLAVKGSANSRLIESINYHLAKLSLLENVTDFLNNWHDYVKESVQERAIEQKRDDLERIGIESYFKHPGVDAPASRLTLIAGDKKTQFNIDIELKHDAKSFFNKSEASNVKKYPRLPLMIIGNKDSSNQPTNQYLLHPTVSLEVLLSDLKKHSLSALPILKTTSEEIARLTSIVESELKDIKKISNKKARSSKKIS